MQRNPLLANLLRKSGMPTLWLTAAFGIVVGGWVILSMQPGLAGMLSKGADIPDNEAWLSIAALLVLLGAPVMVGVNAAAFTVRHDDPAILKKAKLSGISRAEKMQGYFWAALHRMRVPLALAVGLAPAPVIAITEIALAVYQAYHPGCLSGGPCTGIAAAPVFDVTHWLVINGLLAAGAVGFSPLGAAIGTWAALTWKRAVVAPAIVVACMAAATAIYVSLLGPSDQVALPVAIAAGVGPYLLTAGVVALASLGGVS